VTRHPLSDSQLFKTLCVVVLAVLAAAAVWAVVQSLANFREITV
jgi:hypothetical protein